MYTVEDFFLSVLSIRYAPLKSMLNNVNVLKAEMQLWIIKPIKMYNQLFFLISLSAHVVFFLFVLTCTCMVFFYSVNHRIVYLYVWFVSICLCCIRHNKSYVVVKFNKCTYVFCYFVCSFFLKQNKLCLL